MRVFLKTFGCQMNKADSERMLAILEADGYRVCESIEEADVAIANTCSIRGKAEDKLFSLLGEWKVVRRSRPLVIAVVGCIAQQEGEALRRRVPEIDILLGTHTYHHLSEALKAHSIEKTPYVELGTLDQKVPDDLPSSPQGKQSAWITAMQGCTNFCSYCIVPYTRGPEASRAPRAIRSEVERLAARGFVEFTLLGQNVNAYGKDLEDTTSLALLLKELDEVGVSRLRFVTSHPRDLGEDLVRAVADIPSVCEYFHLPLQAGSDKVLMEMNRGYSSAEYLEKIGMIRRHVPDASITSDLIVGFPGETEEEFLETLDMVERVGFDLCNTAAYSRRPHTPAGERKDQVSDEIKSERLNRLNALVMRVARDRNLARIGLLEEVLVEEKQGDRYSGRTRGNKKVFFGGPGDLIGKTVMVRITSASPWALQGVISRSTPGTCAGGPGPR